MVPLASNVTGVLMMMTVVVTTKAGTGTPACRLPPADVLDGARITSLEHDADSTPPAHAKRRLPARKSALAMVMALSQI
jgi:hypothetical protein